MGAYYRQVSRRLQRRSGLTVCRAPGTMRRVSRNLGFSRRDWLMGAAFFVAGLVCYLPFRSQFAFHWDSASFAIAIRDYNVTISQPHPPGFFLYVMAGRLVNWFVGDPHQSLLWMSVVAGAGLAAVLYLLGTALVDRRVGLAAGLFSLTSPQIWFHSSVALTYVVDGLLVSLVVLCCWRAIQQGVSWRDAVLIGALLAVAGGVRQQTVPALLPLVLYSLWQAADRRVLKVLLAGGVALVLAGAWLLPMVHLSGGWSAYLDVVRRFSAFNAPKTFMAGGWSALSWNVFFSGVYCWNGLTLGAPVLVVLLVWGIVTRQARTSRALNFVTLWVGAMAAFGILVAYTEMPGHVLSYLPGLLVLTAMVVGEIRNQWRYGITVGAVVLVNAVSFLVLPTAGERLFFGVARTATVIREHDAQVELVVRHIRAHYDPATTLICHDGEDLLFGFRIFQLYLPEYEQCELKRDPVMNPSLDTPAIMIRNGRTEFVAAIDWQAKRDLIVVAVPGKGMPALPQFPALRELPGAEGLLYEVQRQSTE